MKRVVLVLLFYCSIVLLFSGCATARKQKELELQGLKNRIFVLAAQVQSKDEEISGLRDALSKVSEEKEELEKQTSKKTVIDEVKSRPNAKQIQVALKKAGLDPGKIDGKMGKQTRNATKAFQQANNLAVDGKVGKETWDLLKKYLYKKAK